MRKDFVSLILLITVLIGPSFHQRSVHGEILHWREGSMLDLTEKKLKDDVELEEFEVIREGDLLQQSTKNYIEAKFTENLFKTLRSLAEKELHRDDLSSDMFRPLPRQSSEEEEEGEEDSDSGSSTTRRPTNIIPQVANLVKAIFGGNSINITSYAQAATKYLPPSVGNQVLGVVKLLAYNPSSRWTTTTTTTPATNIKEVKPSVIIIRTNTTDPLNSYSTNTNTTQGEDLSSLNQKENIDTTTITTKVEKENSNSPAPTKKPKDTTTEKVKVTTDDEEEEDEEEDNSRQLRLPGLTDGLNALFQGNRRKTAINATTESASGFEEETTGAPGLDLRELASGIRTGLGDLIKVVPDLFKGAREAIGLLSGIQSLLGSFGG